MDSEKKIIALLGVIIVVLLVLICCTGGEEKLDPVTSNSLTYQHNAPEATKGNAIKVPTGAAGETTPDPSNPNVTLNPTQAAEATSTPTPTPNTSDIDTTKIVSKYNPNMDKTGLEVIDQTTLGKTNEIKYLKGLTEKGAVVEIINGTTYVNGLLMVNKTYSLPSYYVPTNTHANVINEDYVNEGITGEVWEAWVKLRDAATAEGLSLYLSSGYRSYEKQDLTWNNYASWYGKEQADTFSARAGYSEHQSGLCFDLNSISSEFLNTPEGQWVDKNCQKYGFCIRFPKDKDAITGYKYECWHLRYVGVELATELYNNGNWLSMEEYFGIESHFRE